MKDFAGTPGTVTGLALRIAQCMFAAGSIISMATTSSFFNFTAFCFQLFLGYAYLILRFFSSGDGTNVDKLFGNYLIASMGLQAIWSLGLALLDAYALFNKRVLHNSILVSLFIIGDWVTATLSLAAASASGGIAVLYFHDLGGCTIGAECRKYQLSVAFAFLSWLTIFISSLIMFWLLAAG